VVLITEDIDVVGASTLVVAKSGAAGAGLGAAAGGVDGAGCAGVCDSDGSLRLTATIAAKPGASLVHRMSASCETRLRTWRTFEDTNGPSRKGSGVTSA
jgi:hypothetical protein